MDRTVLRVFRKVTGEEHKYIVYSDDAEMAYVYTSNINLPAKLYFDPIYGKLAKENIKNYAEKHGYQLVYKLVTASRKYNVLVINHPNDVNDMKLHFQEFVTKSLSFGHSDSKVLAMCKYLSIIYGNI